MKYILLITAAIIALSAATQSYYKSADSLGWFSYKIHEENITEKNITKKSSKKEIELPQNLDELSAEEFEKLMNVAKGIATMNPTKQNVKKLIILRNYMDAKASEMTKIWTNVMLEEPELDTSHNIPKSSFAKRTIIETTKEEKRKTIERFGKNITLVLFYDIEQEQLTKSQDDVFGFIRSDYPAIRQLKININNTEAAQLIKELKIKKDYLPDLWIIINDNKKLRWKRIAVGLTTKEKIIGKVYEYLSELFKEEKR